jgi:nitrile hydratase subunit beta
MNVRFDVGDRVRVRASDPAWHTRVPRYVRGTTGEVVELRGRHPLPDDVVRGVDPPGIEDVYAVRFLARDLWGEGDHDVTVELWDAYLERVEERP